MAIKESLKHKLRVAAIVGIPSVATLFGGISKNHQLLGRNVNKPCQYQNYAQINRPILFGEDRGESKVKEDRELKIGINAIKQTANNYLNNIVVDKSPNFSASANRNYELIVLHTTEGSGEGARSWLKNPKSNASAHYIVMKDGQIVQLVDESNVAWHCRGNNTNSIGIEMAGSYLNDINQYQRDAVVQLVRDIQSRYNIPKSGIIAHSELDPQRRKDPGKRNIDAILSEVN